VPKLFARTRQRFVVDAVKIGNIFGFLNFTRYCSNVLQVRWKSLRHIH